MTAPFDHIATTYDTTFTGSVIGKLQRNRVWAYMNDNFPELDGKQMLELNCGTGEDAVMFARLGCTVLATDVSIEMLNTTKRKILRENLSTKVSTQLLDLTQLQEKSITKKFDIIFSNFGGLNCIDANSLKNLFQYAASLLNPKGRFIAVVMPEFCLWETLYFFAKLQLKSAFRRSNRKGVIAKLQNTSVKTWYYNPHRIKSWAGEYFRVITKQPVGIVVPPSYLENFFSTKQQRLQRLNAIEKKLNTNSFLSGMADHYLIDLELK